MLPPLQYPGGKRHRRPYRGNGLATACQSGGLLALSAAFTLTALVVAVAWRRASLSTELARGAAVYKLLDHPNSIPILIPVFERPQYLRRVIEALRAVRHINASVLVFSQDGSNQDVAAAIRTIDFAPVVHLRHSPPWLNLPSIFLRRTDAPTAANVHFLLSFAFDALVPSAAAAIVLESDLLPSPDFLDYFAFVFGAVAASPKLAREVFTINGYYEGSAKGNDLFGMSRDAAGFMVWGWLCPLWSWPSVRAGWTWFANWDFAMERERVRSGKVSLSPLVSRVVNIGMKGINFNVVDAGERERWEGLYSPASPIDYEGVALRLLPGTGQEAAG